MATLAQMQQQREQLLAEIKRRGGTAKAPKFAQQLTALEGQIRAAKGPASTQPVATPKQTQRQETRLEYLKRVDPKSPEIKELQKKLAGSPAAGAPGAGAPATDEPFDQESIEKFLDGILDGFKPLDLSGAPKLLGDGDLEKLRQENQDALYAEDARFLDRNRARDLEEKKQELADRGISYNPEAEFDPNSKDLYGRTIGAVNENYSKEQQAALARARTGADQRLGVQSAANIAARNSFADNAAKSYYGQLDAINSGNSLLQTMMNKYGIDQETAQRILDRKSNERLTKMGIRARGGGGSGGGGGGSSDSTGGFEIIS